MQPQVKVNTRKNDKSSRPGTTILSSGGSIEEFRLYIVTLEGYLKEALNENLKLKTQLNEFNKKNPFDLKKAKAKNDELINKYSKGKYFLNELEKKIQLKPINQLILNDMNKNGNPNEGQSDAKIKNLIT